MGLVLCIAAFSTIILAAPLQYSVSSLTSRISEDGKLLRKSSAEVGESIAKLNLMQSTWQVFAGLHGVVAAGFVAWIYLFRSQKYGRSGMGVVGAASTSVLANNVTFSIGMIDMLFWGYLYTTIKEERRTVLQVMEKRRTEDEEDEANKTG